MAGLKGNRSRHALLDPGNTRAGEFLLLGHAADGIRRGPLVIATILAGTTAEAAGQDVAQERAQGGQAAADDADKNLEDTPVGRWDVVVCFIMRKLWLVNGFFIPKGGSTKPTGCIGGCRELHE